MIAQHSASNEKPSFLFEITYLTYLDSISIITQCLLCLCVAILPLRMACFGWGYLSADILSRLPCYNGTHSYNEALKMVDFECGAEVIAEGLSPQIMVVESVGTDSVVCSYSVGDDRHTVELKPCSLRLATKADSYRGPMLFMPSRYRS